MPCADLAMLTDRGAGALGMEGEDVSRELDLPYMAAQGTIPAGLHGKITFEVVLQNGGTAGTAPPWAQLMRACGCNQTVSAGASVTCNPVSSGHAISS